MSRSTSFEEPRKVQTAERRLPRPFLLRRLHSLMGLWLAIYLFEHLLVNSQAALYFEDYGWGFIRLVNKIHAVPYLKVVEIVVLGLPFLIHMGWGIQYALRSRWTARYKDATHPHMERYPRQRSYSWQRITSWILLVGVIGHVVQMRFIDYPVKFSMGDHPLYAVRLGFDRGLYPVTDQINASIYNTKDIQNREEQLREKEKRLTELQSKGEEFDDNRPRMEAYYALVESVDDERAWVDALSSRSLNPDQVFVVAPSAGAAFLLVVRETFKSPLMVILYSLFVVAAAYHGFNGLWTFLISWGVTLSRRSQRGARNVCLVLMWVVGLMGLVAAWGTYFIVQVQG